MILSNTLTHLVQLAGFTAKLWIVFMPISSSAKGQFSKAIRLCSKSNKREKQIWDNFLKFRIISSKGLCSKKDLNMFRIKRFWERVRE